MGLFTFTEKTNKKGHDKHMPIMNSLEKVHLEILFSSDNARTRGQ